MNNGNDPPTFYVWKFLMKNMIPTNSGLTVLCLLVPPYSYRLLHLANIVECYNLVLKQTFSTIDNVTMQ